MHVLERRTTTCQGSYVNALSRRLHGDAFDFQSSAANEFTLCNYN